MSSWKSSRSLVLSLGRGVYSKRKTKYDFPSIGLCFQFKATFFRLSFIHFLTCADFPSVIKNFSACRSSALEHVSRENRSAENAPRDHAASFCSLSRECCELFLLHIAHGPEQNERSGSRDVGHPFRRARMGSARRRPGVGGTIRARYALARLFGVP